MTGVESAVELTIAMPVYNEAGTIERVVRSALEVAGEAPGGGEVLVVDDGSTDETPGILARLEAEAASLRVVRHDHNQGIGGYGRRMLVEARGTWVFIISSDGEFDCREALRFLVLAKREAVDAVLGFRRVKRYSPYRLLVSWLFKSLVFLLFGARYRDIGCVRLQRRAVYASIRLYSESAFSNAERLLVASRQGASSIEVQVEHYPRSHGKGGGAKLGKVVEALLDLIRVRLRWFRFSRYYGR